MADFSKDILNQLRESNKRLEILEKQGIKDDTPKDIIADALPEVLAERRYGYEWPKTEGVFETDDIIKRDLEAGKNKPYLKSILGALDPKGAAAAEKAAEKAAKDKKDRSLLTKIADHLGKMQGKMFEKMKSAGKGIWAVIKGTMLAGFLVALLAFLESDTWKKMKENIEVFLDNPTWGKFFDIFEPVGKWSIIAAIGGLALLFTPIRTTMAVGGFLWKKMKGLVGMFGEEGFFNKGIRRLLGLAPKKVPKVPPTGGIAGAARGAARAAAPAAAAVARGAGSLKAVGKGLLRGARFLGPIGLAAAAAVTIYDGVKAGMEEYEKTGDLAASIKTGAAASLSSLTFGLVSTETFKDTFDWIGGKTIALTTGVKDMAKEAWVGVKDLIPTKEKLTTAYTDLKDKVAGITTSVTDAAEKAYTAVKDKIPTKKQLTTAYTGLKDKVAGITTSVTTAATAAWTSVKDLIPTEAKLKEKFTTLKNDLTPLLEIKLPTEFTFAGIKESVGTMATALNTSFANITGIDVDATLTKIGEDVTAKATKLLTSFKNITGIDVSDTLTSIKTGVTAKAAALVDSFEDITGLTVPTFADIETKIADIGKSLKDNFSGIMDKATGFFSSTTDWFTGLFSSKPQGPKHVAAMIKKYGQTEEAAKEAGLYTDYYRGKSDINRDLLKAGVESGTIQKALLQAIIDDKELTEDDLGFMEKLVKQATTTNSLFTHDQGLYDRLDRIFPPTNQLVMNAQRTEQILASGINRSMQGMGGGSPALINAPVNTVNNSQSNTTVASTELKHPSPLLASVNLAA